MPYFILSPLSDGKEESIMHWNAVRLRLTGTGNLRMTMLSLSSVSSHTLTPLAMQTTTDREPVVLANFISQRMMLKGETTAIDEFMSVAKVIVFTKQLWSQYAGA